MARSTRTAYRWRYDRLQQWWECDELSHVYVARTKDGRWAVYFWLLPRPGFGLLTLTGKPRRFESRQAAQRAAEVAAKNGGRDQRDQAIERWGKVERDALLSRLVEEHGEALNLTLEVDLLKQRLESSVDALRLIEGCNTPTGSSREQAKHMRSLASRALSALADDAGDGTKGPDRD